MQMKKDFLPLLRDFSIKQKLTDIKNSRANSTLELVYQVLGDILYIKNLQQFDFDTLDKWSDILSSAAWALCSTHHITQKASPAQSVLDSDMLLNIKVVRKFW